MEPEYRTESLIVVTGLQVQLEHFRWFAAFDLASALSFLSSLPDKSLHFCTLTSFTH